MRFNAFLCILFTERSRFDINKKLPLHFVRFHFRQTLHALAFFVFCLFLTSKHTRCTTSFFQDVSIKVSMTYHCIRTFQTSQVPCCLPFHHLLFSIMSPSSASRWNMRAATILPSPNSLALCTGRSAFTKVPQQFGCPFTHGCE